MIRLDYFLVSSEFILPKRQSNIFKRLIGGLSFIFTPKHRSWLYMVEGFFNKMIKQVFLQCSTTKCCKYHFSQELRKSDSVWHLNKKEDTVFQNHDKILHLYSSICIQVSPPLNQGVIFTKKLKVIILIGNLENKLILRL